MGKKNADDAAFKDLKSLRNRTLSKSPTNVPEKREYDFTSNPLRYTSPKKSSSKSWGQSMRKSEIQKIDNLEKNVKGVMSKNYKPVPPRKKSRTPSPQRISSTPNSLRRTRSKSPVPFPTQKHQSGRSFVSNGPLTSGQRQLEQDHRSPLAKSRI